VVSEFIERLKGPAGDDVAVGVEHVAGDLKHAQPSYSMIVKQS
jgi:hypothetical protein